MEEYNTDNQYTNSQRPNDLLVWSILSTILCCIATGIVAIVYSSKVNGLWDAGDHAGAQDAARKAKTWNLVGLGIGLVGWVLWLVYFFTVYKVMEANGGLEGMADMMSQFDLD